MGSGFESLAVYFSFNASFAPQSRAAKSRREPRPGTQTTPAPRTSPRHPKQPRHREPRPGAATKAPPPKNPKGSEAGAPLPGDIDSLGPQSIFMTCEKVSSTGVSRSKMVTSTFSFCVSGLTSEIVAVRVSKGPEVMVTVSPAA